jgi:hypothetical protein
MVNPKKSTFSEIDTIQFDRDIQSTDLFEKNKSKFNNTSLLKYPNDLGTKGQEAFMMFDIVEPVRLFGGGEAKVMESIALYMPPTLKVQYSADYDEVESSMKRFVAGVNTAGDVLADGYEAAINGDMANLGSRYGSSAAREGIKLGTGVMDALTGSDLSRQAQIQSGVITNPHMAVAFNGIPFREFQFSFQMMAKTSEESFAIREIIRRFKEAMHPDIGGGGLAAAIGGRFWYYPLNFRISLYTPVQGRLFMFKIKTCALTDVNVDYAGSGVPSFFRDTGAPVDVRLDLKFKELTVLTRKDFAGDENH